MDDFQFRCLPITQAVIINESMVKALNLKEPIGQHLFNWRGEWTVIGVVEDFHFQSMKEHIQPMGMFLGASLNTVFRKK